MAMTLAACGGGPSDPSGQEIVLHGTVVSAASASAAASVRASAASQAVEITVTVLENTAITTTVGPDGRFTLRGLPAGTFTLQFTSGGLVLGTIVFDAVRPNQEITITVSVDATTVTLLEQQRNGIGHGDVEIEGLVSSVLTVDPAGESRFLIAGKTVVARPGQTAIREGGSARTVSDVTEGRRVHVKGVWLPTEASVQPVLAHEIKLQGDDSGDGPGQKTCMIQGGTVGSQIQLEGHIASGTPTSFMMTVNGNRASGPVEIDATAATFQCNGPGKPTAEQCTATAIPGAKVHVSGTLESCDLATALTVAREVKIQK